MSFNVDPESSKESASGPDKEYEIISFASLSVVVISPIDIPAEFSLKIVLESVMADGAVLSNTAMVRFSDFVPPLLSVEVTVTE